MDVCENCEREIGNLEQVYDYDGHAVCRDCCIRLDEPGSAGDVTSAGHRKYAHRSVVIGALLTAGGVVAAFGFWGRAGTGWAIVVAIVGFLVCAAGRIFE